VQAAAELAELHEHGTWWVGLQAVRDPERVLPAIAEAIGAQADPAQHIGDRRMLLVVDNPSRSSRRRRGSPSCSPPART
jgi:predicted ATPase